MTGCHIIAPASRPFPPVRDFKHPLQRWHPLVRLGLFTLVYAPSVWLGMRLSPPDTQISALWPASGVLLAALVLSRPRHWPWLLGTAFLVEPLASAPGLLPPPGAFFLSLHNALEALLGAWLLHRFARFRPSLERVRDVLALLVLGAVIAPVASAVPNVTFLALIGEISWKDWGVFCRAYWAGDATGVLFVTPVLLTWSTRWRAGWSRPRQVELLLLLVAFALAAHLTLRWGAPRVLAPPADLYRPQPLASYLAFPIVFWAALRFEARGTSLALLTLAAVIAPHTVVNSGPFALEQIQNSSRLLLLQSFLGSLGVTGLLLAAVVAQRRHAHEKLDRLNRQLQRSLEELAAAQQALVHRERMAALGELSASVAHEVRNPLAVIANSVAALLRLTPATPPSTTWELLGVISEEVTRLDHLVYGLLDFARPTEPRLLEQSLREVVEGALESSLRSVPRAAEVQVTRAFDPALPAAPLDAALLHLALSNLFTNALQAMPQGGTLRVELGRDTRPAHAPRARVTIADTGPGIPPDVMRRLFEPFFTTKATGTGLGLAIVRRIVEAHHGQVEVHSTPGQGTAFTVHLPLPPEPP